jgi:hypothetical protein
MLSNPPQPALRVVYKHVDLCSYHGDTLTHNITWRISSILSYFPPVPWPMSHPILFNFILGLKGFAANANSLCKHNTGHYSPSQVMLDIHHVSGVGFTTVVRLSFILIRVLIAFLFLRSVDGWG